MATRSTISLRLGNGSVKTIYCHWDGHAEENSVGGMLKKYYNTREKVEALLELGSLSSLNENLTPTDPTHSFNKPQMGVTIAYGRDRGETDVEAVISETYDEAQKEEYNYLFENGTWYVGDSELGLETFLPQLNKTTIEPPKDFVQPGGIYEVRTLSYSEYLFSCLWKHFYPRFDALPYDAQFNLVKEAYAEFVKSTFNDPEDAEYECIEAYLKAEEPIPHTDYDALM